jgi:hypothetical protein
VLEFKFHWVHLPSGARGERVLLAQSRTEALGRVNNWNTGSAQPGGLIWHYWLDHGAGVPHCGK